MIEIIYSQLSQFSLIVSVCVMFILYVFIINKWPQWQQKKSFIKYNGIQRAHIGEIPRLGGVIIYTGLFIYWMFCKQNLVMPFLSCLLISSLPLLFISIKEDILHNTWASSRLILMTLSCILFFLLYDIPAYPEIEFPILGKWISNSSMLSMIFFSFCVLVVINGSNLIDGANGLLPITLFMQCLSLLFIAHEANDIVNMTRLIYIILPLVIFTAFNFPAGKIFLGDSGAYFLGFMIGLLTIIIFSEHPDIPTWLAVLILFYPCFELLFSIIRKLLEGKSPLEPDLNHLHLKMFYTLRSNDAMSPRIANSMVMPSLALIWGMPFILLVWVKESIVYTVLSIFIIMIIYLGFYFALPRKTD